MKGILIAIGIWCGLCLVAAALIGLHFQNCVTVPLDSNIVICGDGNIYKSPSAYDQQLTAAAIVGSALIAVLGATLNWLRSLARRSVSAQTFSGSATSRAVPPIRVHPVLCTVCGLPVTGSERWCDIQNAAGHFYFHFACAPSGAQVHDP